MGFGLVLCLWSLTVSLGGWKKLSLGAVHQGLDSVALRRSHSKLQAPVKPAPLCSWKERGWQHLLGAAGCCLTPPPSNTSEKLPAICFVTEKRKKPQQVQAPVFSHLTQQVCAPVQGLLWVYLGGNCEQKWAQALHSLALHWLH